MEVTTAAAGADSQTPPLAPTPHSTLSHTLSLSLSHTVSNTHTHARALQRQISLGLGGAAERSRLAKIKPRGSAKGFGKNQASRGSQVFLVCRCDEISKGWHFPTREQAVGGLVAKGCLIFYLVALLHSLQLTEIFLLSLPNPEAPSSPLGR